jgi:type VI secretion system protein ImpC
VLIEAFKEDGWSLAPGASAEVGPLPVHTLRKGGETLVKPGAEAWLIDRTADALKGRGLIAILSIKGRDTVRVTALDSVALPSRPLALRLS